MPNKSSKAVLLEREVSQMLRDSNDKIWLTITSGIERERDQWRAMAEDLLREVVQLRAVKPKEETK